jgi:hypothetical protein
MAATPRRDGAINLSPTDGIAHDESPTLPNDGVAYDLHHIVAHELGHSLGLNDERREECCSFVHTVHSGQLGDAPPIGIA